MRRRALLGAVAAVGSMFGAGCSSTFGIGGDAAAETPAARFEMTTIADGKLPSQVLYSVAQSGGDEASARLIENASNGGTTTNAVRPPLPEDQHIAYDGTVYELDRKVVAETPATTYSIKLDVVTGSLEEDKAVAFAALPEVDRDVLADAGLASGDVVGVGTSLLYTDEQRAASQLVPDPEFNYITWSDGAEARWVVDDAHETTLSTYRYTAETIASTAEYGRRMRERFAFTFDAGTDAQRQIVETAIEDDMYVVDRAATMSEAFRALVDQFRDQEQAQGLIEEQPGDLSGPYLARYDGTVYWTTLVVYRTLTGTSTNQLQTP